MAKTNFTKGPLSARQIETTLTFFDILSPEGCIIGGSHVNQSVWDREEMMVEEAEANANLWAASPEMYEALCRARDLIKAWVPAPDSDLAMIEAAIAKAEGKEVVNVL